MDNIYMTRSNFKCAVGYAPYNWKGQYRNFAINQIYPNTFSLTSFILLQFLRVQEFVEKPEWWSATLQLCLVKSQCWLSNFKLNLAGFVLLSSKNDMVSLDLCIVIKNITGLQQNSEFGGTTRSCRIMLCAEWNSKLKKRTVRIAGNGTE